MNPTDTDTNVTTDPIAASAPTVAAPSAPVSDSLEQQRTANVEATSAVAEETAHRGVTPWGDLALEDDGMPRAEDLRTALKAVIDPEIGYSIVDIGLVYEVTKDDDGGVHVLMTLTSMGCPMTEIIHQQCSVILGSMPGVDAVDVEFTFSPPWSTSMIEPWVAEEMRALGMNV
jgi:metal-sulfur cluster biosynthetic enzyme